MNTRPLLILIALSFGACARHHSQDQSQQSLSSTTEGAAGLGLSNTRVSFFNSTNSSNNATVANIRFNLVQSSSSAVNPSSNTQFANLIASSPYADAVFLASIDKQRKLTPLNSGTTTLTGGCYSFAIVSQDNTLVAALRGVSIENFFASLPSEYMLSTVGALCIDDTETVYQISFLSPWSAPNLAVNNFMSYLSTIGLKVQGAPGQALGLGPTLIESLFEEDTRKLDRPSEEKTEGSGKILLNALTKDDLILSHQESQITASTAGSSSEALFQNISSSLNMDKDRSQLLGVVRSTYFPKEPPKSLVYFGSGADIGNPLLATGSAEMIFVDTQEPLSSMLENLKTISGADVTVVGPAGPTSRLTQYTLAKNSKSPLRTLEYQQTGYGNYFQNSTRKYDVIFDKDSWIDSAKNPEDFTAVVKAATALNTGGVWISNHFAGIDLYADLFKAGGMERVTSKISSNDAYAYPFGNLGNVEILSKTGDYNEQAFSDAYLVFTKTKMARNTIDPTTGNNDLGAMDDESYDDMKIDFEDQFDGLAGQVQTDTVRALVPQLKQNILTRMDNLRKAQKAN